MRRKRNSEELSVDEHPIWSPTKLDTAEQCMKFYWIKYIKKAKYPINASITRGKLFHFMIEHFWKKDKDSPLYIPKYSYEGFIGATLGNWKRFYAQGKEPNGKALDEICWDYEGQQWDKSYHGEIAEIAGKVYSRYIHEEPRIAAEVKLHAEVEGIKIMAIVDELRKDLAIRDHKSGYKKPKEMYLDRNIQMTDYLLCVFIALQDINSPVSKQIYPDYFNISLKEFLDIARIEIHHLPDSTKFPRKDKETGEFHFIEKEPETEIFYAKRSLQSINDFVSQLQAKERQLQEREFVPKSGRQCDYCLARSVCNQYDPLKEHRNELERNMPLFSFANLTFGNMKSEKQQNERQTTIRFKYLKD